MNRILALAEKELLEIRRDKVLPRLIVLLPTLMLLLFGYAINFTLTGIPLSVYDGSQDRISETLLGELTREDRFRVALRAATPEEVRESLDRGQARVGVVIPPGALERVRAGETVQLEIYLDGSDPNFAFQAQALLRRAVQEVNARVLMGRALSGEAVLPPLSPVLHTLYNPENKTAWFMIPGIIGLILTQFTVLLTALSIVREEESRMMEALLASPLRPHEVVLGKVLPYLGIGAVLFSLLIALLFWVQRGAHLELQGAIARARTLELPDGSTIVILDFRITNVADYPFVVKNVEVFLESAEGKTWQGAVASDQDATRLFQYYPVLGPRHNPTLLVRTRIGPHESLDRMLAVRFELPEEAVLRRRTFRVRVVDVDGAVSEIAEQRR